MYLLGFLRSIIALTCPFPLNAHVISHFKRHLKLVPYAGSGFVLYVDEAPLVVLCQKVMLFLPPYLHGAKG